MLGPFATASCLTPTHQVSLPVLSRAACASMSTTPTTTRDRRDRYGPMEWAQLAAELRAAAAGLSCITFDMQHCHYSSIEVALTVTMHQWTFTHWREVSKVDTSRQGNGDCNNSISLQTSLCCMDWRLNRWSYMCIMQWGPSVHVRLLLSDQTVFFIGPIPWAKAVPCHALSLLSWTSHATCAIAIAGVRLATPGDWQCNGGSQ